MSNIEYVHINYTEEEIANHLQEEVESQWEKELHDLINDSFG